MAVVAEDITITHYINPHCFWYKSNATYMPEDKQYLFSLKLNDKCVALYGGEYIVAQTVREPSVVHVPGNVVAVYNTVQQRWNRCVVDEVITCIGCKRLYRLWALDEGIPIQSSPEYVRPLPAEFKAEPAHAKRGALLNIFPLETKNYSMSDAPCRMASQWYTGAVSMMETLLELALSVSMVERGHIVSHGELVHFGDMTIESTDNQGCDVSQFLCENCPQQVAQGLGDSMVFNNILQLKTLRMSRYQTNEGIDNTTKQITWMKNNPRQRDVPPVVSPPGGVSPHRDLSPLRDVSPHRDVSLLQQMNVPQDGNSRKQATQTYIAPAGNINPIPHNVRKLRNEVKKGRTTVPKATQTNAAAPAGDVKITSIMKRLEISEKRSEMDTKLSPTTPEQGKRSEEPPIRRLNFMPAGFSIERALANLPKQTNNKG